MVLDGIKRVIGKSFWRPPGRGPVGARYQVIVPQQALIGGPKTKTGANCPPIDYSESGFASSVY
jgi:hypothetical protein